MRIDQAKSRELVESWPAAHWGWPAAPPRPLPRRDGPSASPTASSWRGMPHSTTGRPSRPWWRGTGRWSLATCRADPAARARRRGRLPGHLPRAGPEGASVRAGDALGGWLHRVAYRVAVQAEHRGEAERRRESEESAMDVPDATAPGSISTLHSILHEEIDRLPERQRLPVVLCDLEGLTYEQAAGRLRLDRADALPSAGQGPAAAARSPEPARRDRRRRWASSIASSARHRRRSRRRGPMRPSRRRRAGPARRRRSPCPKPSSGECS